MRKAHSACYGDTLSSRPARAPGSPSRLPTGATCLAFAPAHRPDIALALGDHPFVVAPMLAYDAFILKERNDDAEAIQRVTGQLTITWLVYPHAVVDLSGQLRLSVVSRRPRRRHRDRAAHRSRLLVEELKRERAVAHGYRRGAVDVQRLLRSQGRVVETSRVDAAQCTARARAHLERRRTEHAGADLVRRNAIDAEPELERVADLRPARWNTHSSARCTSRSSEPGSPSRYHSFRRPARAPRASSASVRLSLLSRSAPRRRRNVPACTNLSDMRRTSPSESS